MYRVVSVETYGQRSVPASIEVAALSLATPLTLTATQHVIFPLHTAIYPVPTMPRVSKRKTQNLVASKHKT